jgi:DNA-binding LacI/PurR family transcriptional regulator
MATSSRVTIKDVSRTAQVSVTTVSHALNGRGRVGTETRARILAVAEELGYVANPIARALKSGRTMTILAELPATAETGGLDSAFLRDVLVGAAERAMETGYLLAVAGRTSAARSVLPPNDGALVVDPVADDPVLEDAARRGVPMVTVSRFADQPDVIPAVGSDYVAGIKGILDHLAAAGYERPALLSTREPFAYAQSSLEGYEEWMRDAGRRGRVRYAAGYPSVPSGRAAARALLGLKTPPDAIIAVTEPLAVGALQALSEDGVRVPEEMGVASVSDSERLRSATVPVTALDLYPAEIGRRAMGLLVDLIESGDTPSGGQSLELPTRLHLRASTAGRSTASG